MYRQEDPEVNIEQIIAKIKGIFGGSSGGSSTGGGGKGASENGKEVHCAVRAGYGIGG